ncbi:glycosyltransferase [Cellulophaga fucicola]|uniref:glycosyltransferase n=1 Tax=Cellulophaga fucicola TaxID=76595 RepID=UPI003EB6B138
MIFVTLGNQNFQFNRLLNSIEIGIKQGYINEKVIVQTGFTSFKSNLFETINFLGKEDFENHIKESSYVISHAGTGSIISCINAKKKVIVAARLSEYREHIDDHQVEILSAFKKKNYIVGLDLQLANFKHVIESIDTVIMEEFISNNNKFNSKLIEIINSF